MVDSRTLWSLDKETLCRSAAKTGRCLVVTEAPAEGGWSGEAAAVINEGCWGLLKRPVRRVCGMRTGIPYGAALERAVVPNDEWIAEAARALMRE